MTIELANRGCHVLLSNSTAPAIADLYDGNADARQAGLRALRVPARRAINSNPSRRGPVDEYVITKALDGLYLMVGEEEKKIRKDPVGTGSDIIRRVFGALH